MWLDMRVSVVCLMVMLLSAPVLVAAYNCEDLPNVYTKEDLDVIKGNCQRATVLASNIYPSATWIIHGYLTVNDKLYSDWLFKPPRSKTLQKICIVWLGGYGSAAVSAKLATVSGNCGSSYPIDYADEFNFIDFTSYFSGTVTSSFKHYLMQDVPNNDHYILLVQTAHEDYFDGFQEDSSPYSEGADQINKYVKKTFDNTKFRISVLDSIYILDPKRATLTNQCPGWGIRNFDQLKTCGSIVGPLVYDKDLYGMKDIEQVEDRPYHHGCFTVENNDSEKTLDFLDKLKTGSDYVDRCIGKFANVVRNNKKLCPNPKRYYASMDPNPESLIRMAFLNSEWNKQGVPEVKVEFPKGMTYECVNECSGTIDDSISYRDPVGKYGFPCKIFTGDITLMNDTLKKVPQPDSPRILQHIREIKGRLTVNAEVDSDVLPQLRIVGGSTVRAPALVLTITDENLYEAVLPMRLTKVTATGTEPPVLLRHSMPENKIPQTLKDDLKRSAGSIKYEKIENIEEHKHTPNHFI